MSDAIRTSGETYFGIPTHLKDAHQFAVRAFVQWFMDMMVITGNELFSNTERGEIRAELYRRRRVRYREMSNAFILDGDLEKGAHLMGESLAEFQAYLMEQVARLPETHNDSQEGET